MKGHDRVKGVHAVAFKVYVVAFRVNSVASSVVDRTCFVRAGIGLESST